MRCFLAVSVCAPVMCRMYCEFGWAKGPDGCDMCKCKEAPSKPGFCPAVESGQIGTCTQECSIDDDCKGNQKCCSNGCGHVCTAPEYKGMLIHDSTFLFSLLSCHMFLLIVVLRI